METEYSIETNNLRKEFGSFVALDGLDLKVGKSEFVGLLGPNGAGKSTTLKLLTGLIRPTSGFAKVNGFDIVTEHKGAMADVGCVVETPDFYPGFTPSETLEYIGRLRGMNNYDIRKRARIVLEEMRIWEKRDLPISSFSKGMKQRVALAQALLPNPSLLILDEPTSGLDPRGMIEVRQILGELKKYDVSLLISTHILKEVSELCEKVNMINHGKSMVSGNVEELIKKSGSGGNSEIVFRTLREMSRTFVNDFAACQGVVSTMTMGPNQLKIQFNGTDDQQADLVDFIQNNNLRLVSMTENSGDIESLYMELTKDDEVSS